MLAVGAPRLDRPIKRPWFISNVPCPGAVVMVPTDGKAGLWLYIRPEPSVLNDENVSPSTLISPGFPLVPGISVPKDEQVALAGGAIRSRVNRET